MSRARREALAYIASIDATEDRRKALARDPLRFARRYDDVRDRELAALIAALMAFGSVEVIGSKCETLFALLGPSPSTTVTTLDANALQARLKHFKHRTFRGDDIARLLFAAGTLIQRDGRLFASLEAAFAETNTLRESLARWADAVRAIAWPQGASRTARHLLPDPRGPSACKRLLLLMRWLCRADDGVDLGLVAIPPRALVMPLDVHLHRVSRRLGLTKRKSASWLAAEEVTEALRALDPEDPVKFDFVLCHHEIAAVRSRRAAQSHGT